MLWWFLQSLLKSGSESEQLKPNIWQIELISTTWIAQIKCIAFYIDRIYFSCQLFLSIIHFRGIYFREPYAAWCVLRVCMLWICEILVDVFCLAIYRYFIRLKHTSLLSIKLKSGIHSIYTWCAYTYVNWMFNMILKRHTILELITCTVWSKLSYQNVYRKLCSF